MRRLRLALVLLGLILMGTSVPAGAATRTVADSAPDTGIPAPYDITGVAWDYGDERLVVTAHIAGVRRKGVVLSARSAHDWEGYEVEARTWWEDGKKVDRLWIAYNTISRNHIDCPGLSSRWRRGEDGFIRLNIPNSCLFDGYQMRDFSATTYRLGYSESTTKSPRRGSSPRTSRTPPDRLDTDAGGLPGIPGREYVRSTVHGCAAAPGGIAMARRRARMLAVVAVAALVTAAGAQAGAQAGGRGGPPGHGHGHGQVDRPTKVVIIVVDSLSKEIVDKYGMRNVQALMKYGVDSPRSYLGHTGSVTVVTHNVITSGQLPKHMGWTDEGYRDVAGILGDPEPANPDQLYITSDATTELFKLQQAAGYPKLADYLGAADPAAKTFTISPKGYAGYAFGGAGSDSIITFSSGPGVHHRWRVAQAGGINVPSYILGHPAAGSGCTAATPAPSFAYDTTKLPAVLYPLDSDRYVTGHDPAHEGGDVWAADAAVAIMRNDPTWNGIFVTLPGVDKAAHMWGGRPTRGRPAPTATR